MGVGGRKIRLGKGVRTRARKMWRNYQDNSGSPCPTITLGSDFGSGIATVGVPISIPPLYVQINGGTGPFTPALISGTLPPGLTLGVDSFSGNNFIKLTGTPTLFGIFTPTIGGTDANGCAITPKVYTIEVWQQSVNNTVSTLDVDTDNIIPITVSGISGNAQLVSIKHNIIFPDLDGYIGFYPTSPTVGSVSYLWSFNYATQGLLMTGADLTNCEIYNNTVQSNPDITTSSAPYTGTWNDTVNFPPLESYFDHWFGAMTAGDFNGTWNMHYECIVYSGTHISTTLLFKPLP